MHTPASKRFEKLFANRPQPKIPEKKLDSVSKGESSHRKPQSSPEVQPRDINWANVAQDRPILSSGNVATTASDSDDEYSSLFSKKIAPKSGTARRQFKSETGSLASSKDTDVRSFQRIEYFPSGKPSLTKTDISACTNSSEDESEATGTEKEHALIGQYCVFSLAAKYPYKYMRDPDNRVSQHFFAQNKFYNRKWSLYYLQLPKNLNKPALVLIPRDEMRQLVDEIASTFNIRSEVPPSPFTVNFYDDGTPQPYFLGVSSSRDEFNDLTGSIPEAEANYGECPPDASRDTMEAYEAYHAKVENAIQAAKGKTKSTAQKKANKLFHILEESRDQIVRAERYLGLKPQAKPMEIPSNLSLTHEFMPRREDMKSCGLFIEFLNPNSPAKYPFEHDSVFISLDVESYERNHNLVTEIGISTLDTLDLADLPPGDAGENWVKHIRSRHFRIRGREHLVNTEFCVGNPDAFLFGSSEFVALDTVADAIDDCFEWPFSVQYKKEGPHSSTIDGDSCQTPSKVVDPSQLQKGPKQRNIVLVGHDINSDIRYLRKLGSSIFNSNPHESFQNIIDPSRKPREHILSSILETLDTTTMYQTLKTEPQPRSLSHICTALGIDAWHTHNAGNDARYTLEALIKIVITARLEEDQRQRHLEPDSKGITIDNQTAARQAHLDEKLTRARANVKERLAMLHSTATTTAATEAEYNDDGPIDWTLPFRPSDFRRHKPTAEESEMNVGENTWQDHEQKDETASAQDASWSTEPNESLAKTPRAGW